MYENEQLRWVRGPVASSVVADDPFWSAVRRRDPEITIALLPPEGAAHPGTPIAGPPVVDDPDAHASELLDRARLAWAAYVDVPAATERARWMSGPARGTVRRELTLSATVADAQAERALRVAAEALRTDGWHVLTPAEGIPRVLAGRGDGDLRTELALIRSGERLALRLRSAPVTVGQAVARELVVPR